MTEIQLKQCNGGLFYVNNITESLYIHMASLITSKKCQMSFHRLHDYI